MSLRKKTIDWRGAFIIGLAGTILVTGVTGPVLGEFGSSAIPNFIFISGLGFLLCLCLAELATMFPHRSGGAPSYAFVAFKDKFPRMAPHLNGITSWAYWLGWNPVIAVNMLLVVTYLDAMLKPYGIVVPDILLGAVLSTLLFIPAYYGLRPGALTGVVLAALSVIPLVIIALIPFFKPALIHWGNLFPITVMGKPFFGWQGIQAQMKMSFLTTWNAIAMEAAACYIAECKDPQRDAPIAMALEGSLGFFIYTLVPLSFLLVLGAAKINQDPYGMFVDFVGPVFGPATAWIVAIMLIAALLLSALNAIMGCARSLYQMTIDGQFPHVFAHLNKHGVPDFSMALNVVLNVFLMFLGAPAYVMVFSNVGYVVSFVPVLIAYYYLKEHHPEIQRPYSLPEFFKYIALAMAAIFAVIWIWGGPMWGALYYGLGWLVLLAYVPLYMIRKYTDRRAAGTGGMIVDMPLPATDPSVFDAPER
jgi:amino acid transporter